MHFANRLKYLRIKNKMTQKEIADKLDVSTATVQNWERGTKLPNISVIPRLTNTLHTNADYLIGCNNYCDNENQILSDDEFEIIRLYRKVDNIGRKIMASVGKIEEERVNDCRLSFEKTKWKKIPLYDSPAAAGIGNTIDESNYQMIESDNSSADFAIRISGNSMNPYLEDRDIVLVHSTDKIESGDIGIICVNGAMYCKQLFIGKNKDIYLLSANEELAYTNVYINSESNDSIHVMGKVLIGFRVPFPSYFHEI